MGKQIITTIDPNNEFLPNGATTGRIIEATGLLWIWVPEALTTDAPLIEVLDGLYGYGLHEMDSTIDEKYVRHYPEDPPAYPLVHWYTQCGTDQVVDREVLMYEYAIMAWRDSTSAPWFITRMD